jgi:hypothetical protein
MESVVTGLFNAADYRGDHSTCPVCLRREAARIKELQGQGRQPIRWGNEPLPPDPGPNAVWPPANTTPANTQQFPWRKN